MTGREPSCINLNAVPYMMSVGGQEFQSAYLALEKYLGCATSFGAGPEPAEKAISPKLKFIAPRKILGAFALTRFPNVELMFPSTAIAPSNCAILSQPSPLRSKILRLPVRSSHNL
jgi:hypothetical protein